MRAFVASALMGAGIVVAVMVNAVPAFAVTTITKPSGTTIEVGLDAEKYPAPFTVTAEGFEPYENVFVEQCNGRPPSAAHWTPTVDCDFGTAPAAAVADATGRVTFDANDRNHAPFLFVGPSPQDLFNCLSPNGPSPDNGMEDFRNCQLRVSSSNTAGTDDQVFLTLQLPEGARTGTRKPPEPIVAGASEKGPAGSKASGSGAASGTGSDAASGELASSQSSSSAGSSSSFPFSAVLIPAVVVALGAAYFLLRKRRSGRVAA